MNSNIFYSLKLGLLALLMTGTLESLAGGSGGAIAPGSRTVAGSISEWQVPTAKFPRDPGVGLDGSIFFAIRSGDKIARFDPKTKRFQDWSLLVGTQPLGVLATRDGKVIFGGFGNGTIGELDPSTGRVKSIPIPSGDSNPYTLVLDDEDDVWFTLRKVGKVAKLDRISGQIVEYAVGDKPYSVVLDKRGHVWVTRMAADRVVRLDPKTGKLSEIQLGLGSQPRRTTVTPDGMLWVSLYGVGKVIKIDPVGAQVVKEYELPGGPNAGPYAMSSDAMGRIWVSEIQTDSVVLIDPRSEVMRVIKLPVKNSGVRNATIDSEGRYWYLSSHVGRLGVIE
jgi:virginiamycin B lyase